MEVGVVRPGSRISGRVGVALVLFVLLASECTPGASRPPNNQEASRLPDNSEASRPPDASRLPLIG